MRCGDHVHHEPTGEDWVVAYVDGNYLAWCGWPEGEAKVADCKLIKTCSDDEHLSMLRRVAKTPGKRGRWAAAALKKLDQAA